MVIHNIWDTFHTFDTPFSTSQFFNPLPHQSSYSHLLNLTIWTVLTLLTLPSKVSKKAIVPVIPTIFATFDTFDLFDPPPILLHFITSWPPYHQSPFSHLLNLAIWTLLKLLTLPSKGSKVALVPVIRNIWDTLDTFDAFESPPCLLHFTASWAPSHQSPFSHLLNFAIWTLLTLPSKVSKEAIVPVIRNIQHTFDTFDPPFFTLQPPDPL